MIDQHHKWISVDATSLQNKAWSEWSGQMKEQKEEQYKVAITNLEYQLEQQQKMSEMYREQVNRNHVNCKWDINDRSGDRIGE